MFPEFFWGTENCTIPYPKRTQNVYQYPKRIQNVYKNVYKTEKISYRADSDNEDEDRINFTRITPDNRKYYNIDDSILPGYTGDGGPYFPSITAMWMFIWFIKNNIGNISNYLFKFLY